jgi:hypothetical protein
MPSVNTKRKIESYLRERSLIPVIGPGIITFGDEDEPLYPWLVKEAALRLGLDIVPEDLHHLVCEALRTGRKVKDVCYEVDELLRDPALKPGPTIKRLASLAQCRQFFTLGFDPLFLRALNEVRGNGWNVTRAWCFNLKDKAEDLPDLEKVGTFLGYLFGKVSSKPGFHLWDADAVEFVLKLNMQIPGLSNLGGTLANNNLLFMGTDCSDWLVRFLLRAIRQRPLNEEAEADLFVADPTPDGPDYPGTQKEAVFFYDSMRGGISVMPVQPLDFVRQFCDLALEQEPPLSAGVVQGTDVPIPQMEPAIPSGAVFISYAHTDSSAAFLIVERLRSAGCLVWLDTERLTCGDHFERELEDAVMKHCGFLVAVISKTTEGRAEAYFHKERNWAAKRSISMPETRPFYFPVVIDDSSTPLRHEPRVFDKIDLEQAPGGLVSDELCQRLVEIQRDLFPPTHL